MFVQDTLQNLDVVSIPDFPPLKYILMFIGAVTGPFIFFANDRRIAIPLTIQFGRDTAGDRILASYQRRYLAR